MITEVVGEKRIDLAYLIRGKEVAIVSMFGDNIQYKVREPLKVLLIINQEKELLKGTFTGSELNTFVGRKVIATPLDTSKNVIKTNKLAHVTQVVLSLDEFDNIDNLEDGSLSNVLLRHHMTGSGIFMHLVTLAPQYKRLKNREFASLTPGVIDQKDNGITDGLGMTIVLHIK